MPVLSDTQRKQLKRAVLAARAAAEKGARAALRRLAVDLPRVFPGTGPNQEALRLALRAHARRLGDDREVGGEQGIDRLVAECAYELWHRMLFARFLAENDLLIHPDHGVTITLAECEELAPSEGAPNGWSLAARYAAHMLPRIFRPEDPVLQVQLAPEHQQALESILAGLAPSVFRSDDSLGWVYQFWQEERKREVDKAVKGGREVGRDDLAPKTQLFTEPYMVQFLLHNTLGAWWAAKALAAQTELTVTAPGEDDLRTACVAADYRWAYLRFARETEGAPWRPAAGMFDGWPRHASKLRVLDPCCGSGHFLVEAFRILVALRRAEDGLSPREACDAVLTENIFALELDDRCTQIAAFNLALAAWTYPGAEGVRPLPEMHIACSGLSVGGKEAEWAAIANDEPRLRGLMRRFHQLFSYAPVLGSLVDPRAAVERGEGDIGFDDELRLEDVEPRLEDLLRREDFRRNPDVLEIGVAAQGIARAAKILSGRYTLVATNVPFLRREKQVFDLQDWAEREASLAKGDLATLFIHRAIRLLEPSGAAATVSPQNWCFLSSYEAFRRWCLERTTVRMVAWLGPQAFQEVTGDVVKAVLSVLTAESPGPQVLTGAIDVSALKDTVGKAMSLRGGSGEEDAGTLDLVPQRQFSENPDAAIRIAPSDNTKLLGRVAACFQGISSTDAPRFLLSFWEVGSLGQRWRLAQVPPKATEPYLGRTSVINWLGITVGVPGVAVRGRRAWGKDGVAIGQVDRLPATIYSGELFVDSAPVIVPLKSPDAVSIWAFAKSPDFRAELRRINPKLSVNNGYVAKITCEIERYRELARKEYPEGLPEPQSNRPDQWVFHGHPGGMLAAGSADRSPVGLGDPVGAGRHGSLVCRAPNPSDVLQVAVARLLGYRWPAEHETRMRLDVAARAWASRCEELAPHCDADGIVCLPAVGCEQPATERLQRLLVAALGKAWTPSVVARLVSEAGFPDKSLDDWLRDAFFEQHCALFERPFIWHIWDGRKRDGFAALINYHKLDRKLLERLTYTVLGDWISRQQADVQGDERGAADRLAAAAALQQKLRLILDGEAPHDIFVRWKAIDEQPLGWNPDLDDGVRPNIRPFVELGVLRRPPKGINWNKDRGREPEDLRPSDCFPWLWKNGEFKGERVNDIHLTLAEKRAARAARGRPC